MSEAVSALGGASFDGLVRVEDGGLHGMITLRGDINARAVKSAAKAAAGTDVPGLNGVALSKDGGICWMSPDELLLLCPYDEVTARLAKLEKALAKHHHLAVNVSDARAVFRISGAASRQVLAKLCPVDLAPGAFVPGSMRRTRMAQVPAAFWMDDDETFRIVCFRSAASYVFSLLKTAAQPGSGVGMF